MEKWRSITKEELDQILKNLENAHYVVDEVKHGERTKEAADSIYHQYACSRRHPRCLNFSTQKTMRLAQQLYEGVDVKGHRNHCV